MTIQITDYVHPGLKKPQRIQLKRTKGWRKPEGCVNVARPTRWGNPFKVGRFVRPGDIGWLIAPGYAPRGRNGEMLDFRPIDNDAAVRMFEAWIVLSVGQSGFGMIEEARVELAGKDLACWCPLDQPCHADVLLEVANR